MGCLGKVQDFTNLCFSLYVTTNPAFLYVARLMAVRTVACGSARWPHLPNNLAGRTPIRDWLIRAVHLGAQGRYDIKGPAPRCGWTQSSLSWCVPTDCRPAQLRIRVGGVDHTTACLAHQKKIRCQLRHLQRTRYPAQAGLVMQETRHPKHPKSATESEKRKFKKSWAVCEVLFEEGIHGNDGRRGLVHPGAELCYVEIMSAIH